MLVPTTFTSRKKPDILEKCLLLGFVGIMKMSQGHPLPTENKEVLRQNARKKIVRATQGPMEELPVGNGK